MPAAISKNSGGVPDWMLKIQFPHSDKKETASAVTVSDDKDMVKAKSEMEKCAKDGKQFFFQKDVTPQQKKELEEYAEVCGLKKNDMVGVSKAEKEISAEAQKPVEPKKSPEKDAFNVIKNFADPSSFKKNKDWDKVKPAAKLTSKNADSKSVVRSDGTEKYEEQRIIKVRPGENSISSPDNIEKMANSKEKSSREKTVEANQKRKEEIVFKVKDWEKETSDKAKSISGVIAKPGVKLTEASQEHDSSRIAKGQHGIFDKSYPTTKIPERSVGETFKDFNDKNKDSIQRKKSEDRSWDTVTSSKKEVVSDLLYEELKKRLAKVAEKKAEVPKVAEKKVEPKKVEVKKVEPVKTEPKKIEPVKVEPKKSEKSSEVKK